jgi:predicted ester cyclase
MPSGKEIQAMSTEEIMAIARRIYEAFATGDPGAIDEVVGPRYVCHYMRTEFGREDLKRNVVAMHTAFPDLEVTVEDVFAAVDRVASRYTMRGTHRGMFMGVAPTGKEVTLTGIIISRFAGSRAVEDWEYTDMLDVMRELRGGTHT